jgi:hypothetical protein
VVHFPGYAYVHESVADAFVAEAKGRSRNFIDDPGTIRERLLDGSSSYTAAR